jgi:hypothetical protein
VGAGLVEADLVGAGRQVGTSLPTLLVQDLVSREAKRPARRPVATRKGPIPSRSLPGFRTVETAVL